MTRKGDDKNVASGAPESFEPVERVVETAVPSSDSSGASLARGDVDNSGAVSGSKSKIAKIRQKC